MNPAVDRDEPGKLASGVLAVGVHVAFLALLVFGAAWQQQPPEVVMVDLWNNLPPVPAVKSPSPVPPPPKPEAKPAPPPVAKPEPKVVPPKPVPEPKPAPKPDIAIEKEKQEKARREREEKEKAEQRKREEREKAEVAKREAIEKQKQIEQQKLAALEKEREAKEKQRADLERMQNDAAQRLQQMQAAAQSKELDGFRTKVQDKIKRFVVKAPCAALADPEIVLEMKFFPDGNMIGEPVVRKSSGSPACDDAVRRAAILAQPLPLPPPGHPMLTQFMNLHLRFKPND